MLQIKSVSKTYVTGDLTQRALDSVSFNLRDCEFVAVLGPSGSGKTTLLNVIGGLDRYDSGDLVINGVSTGAYTDRDWDSYRNHTIGFVFQSYNLIPHQSVLANVELALTISGMDRQERTEKAKKALERVGLGDQLHKKPNQLSGGQMQRVAIARALVNDPDILLADEPTGALDSENSVQVMEILKEIACDRLVVLVTHNGELAQEYATRIITLKDGAITGDTNPLVPADGAEAEAVHKNMGRSSMSFMTALSLSFNNLKTKKGRTLLTAFAGSIGIIGIALIMSLSSGVNRYIDDIQKQTMLSYPIEIDAQTLDMTSMLKLGQSSMDRKADHALDGVYSDPTGVEMASGYTTSLTKNNLTPFKKYIDDPDSAINNYLGENGVIYSYDLKYGMYAYDPDGKLVNTDGVTFDDNSMSAMMSGVPETPMKDAVEKQQQVFTQLLPGRDGSLISSAITDNYDLLYGSWPQSRDEVVLMLDENNEIPLNELYELGMLPAEDYSKMMDKLKAGESVDTKEVSWNYADACGRMFYLIPECDFYKQDGSNFKYAGSTEAAVSDIMGGALKLKITGVVRPSDSGSYTLYGVVGYTKALTDYLINYTDSSAVVKAQKASPDISVLNGLEFSPADDAAKIADAKKYISSLNVSGKAEMFTNLMTLASGGDTSRLAMLASQSEQTLAAMLDNYMLSPSDSVLLQIYDKYISPGSYSDNMSAFGEVSLDAPSSISIYTDSFEDKDAISDCIEDYNASAAASDKITYTDYVGLLMSSVTTIVNVISYVLIAFVSVSLIVSSIMIGIITYISVLERTKEIGILRAIGASKRNISQVFNAETFIIGMGSGLIGVGVTLLLLIPGNAVIHSLTGTSSVNAYLPPQNAAILILLSMALTLVAGIIPSRKAAKKDPVTALRTE
jgi:putative ABC transport system permease protein